MTNGIQKRIVALVTVTVMVACTFIGCGGSGDGGGSGSDDGVMVLTIATEENDGECMDIMADLFAENLADISGGTMTVDVYPYGTLSDNGDLFDLCVNGSVNFVITDPGWVEASVPQTGVMYLPYLFPTDLEKMDAFLEAANNGESEGINYLNEKYADLGVTNLQWFAEGGIVWACKDKITSPADFKGVKFRTTSSTINQNAYNSYGADSVTVAYSELYSALQLGTVDGTDQPMFAQYSNSFYEVTGYIMKANQYQFVGVLSANTSFWDSLTEEQQGWVIEAINQSLDDYYAARDQVNEEAEKAIKESGKCEIVEYSEDTIKEFEAVVEPLRKDFITNNCDDGAELYDMFEKDIANICGE